ncbi:MAG: hypothetical protein CVV24_15625, partial [Ignavibacteriae bacterium HGW-Ignavibacteriae-3]
SQIINLQKKHVKIKKEHFMKIKEIIILMLSPVLGFLAFIIPELFGKSLYLREIFTLSFIGDVYENIILIPSVALLIVVGIALGFIRPRLWFISGVLTIIAFPIASLFEMIISPTSHNLWPIEFVIYCIFTIPATLGAYVGKTAKFRL